MDRPLDPSRPARDLLEDLLSGIYGCRLVYAEYADADFGSSAEAEDDDEADEDVDERVDEAFCAAVRARAAQDRGRAFFDPVAGLIKPLSEPAGLCSRRGCS
jgi:hypothetical protein